MKHFRRRTVRAILVPIALLVIVIGGALPASAAPHDANSNDNSFDTSVHTRIGPVSLNW